MACGPVLSRRLRQRHFLHTFPCSTTRNLGGHKGGTLCVVPLVASHALRLFWEYWPIWTNSHPSVAILSLLSIFMQPGLVWIWQLRAAAKQSCRVNSYYAIIGRSWFINTSFTLLLMAFYLQNFVLFGWSNIENNSRHMCGWCCSRKGKTFAKCQCTTVVSTSSQLKRFAIICRINSWHTDSKVQ